MLIEQLLLIGFDLLKKKGLIPLFPPIKYFLIEILALVFSKFYTDSKIGPPCFIDSESYSHVSFGSDLYLRYGGLKIEAI